jgi:glycine/D-amino acid oxidase-like deaminating enzyme
MDLISGCPFWPLKNGLLDTFPALRDNLECEVAIIGGGITGALVGDSLTEVGVNAVILDRRDIGFGSTGASTSLLQYEADMPLCRLSRLVGETAAVRSYQLCCSAIAKLADLVRQLPDTCSFEWQQSLYLASSARDIAGLKAEYEARREAGFAVEYWPRRKIAAESSLPHRAAILSQDAAQFDSFRFTYRLLQRSVARGLRVFDRTTVTGWRRVRTGFELRTDRGACVRARRLVIAAGYEAQPYVRRGLTRLHSTYVIATEPLPEFTGWPGRRLMWETARPYVYLRTTEDNRAVVGGFDEPFRDPVARDALLPAKRQALFRRFRRLFPAIDTDVAYTWTGTFAETRDSLPYIGSSGDDPDLYFALGYGGNGITYGVVAAEIIRDLVLGRPNADANLFRFDR